MTRVAILAVVLCPIVGLAAPVPPLTDQELIAKYWGKVYAPSDKYVFRARDKALTIRTAGEPAIEGFRDQRSTIPRAHRTVTGDFEATVKLLTVSSPPPIAANEMGSPTLRAGLCVAGDFNRVEVELHQYRTKLNDEVWKKPSRVVWFNVNAGGRGEGRHLEDADPTTPVFLRVTRKGNVVTMAWSFDGKGWGETPVPAVFRPLKFPDGVSVGVYLAHTTHQIAEATFTNFIVKKPDNK